jgi:hypothetical protein
MQAAMKRRDILATGLSGAALCWLGRACKTESGSKPGGSTSSVVPQPVYGLSDGRSLYDDFDGHGNLQTFDGQPLAVAGELGSKIWGATYGIEVLKDPFSSPLFSVVDENGQKIESSRPSLALRRLLVIGAADALLETPAGLLPVEKGKVYGAAETVPAGPRGFVLDSGGDLGVGYGYCDGVLGKRTLPNNWAGANPDVCAKNNVRIVRIIDSELLEIFTNVDNIGGSSSYPYITDDNGLNGIGGDLFAYVYVKDTKVSALIGPSGASPVGTLTVR